MAVPVHSDLRECQLRLNSSRLSDLPAINLLQTAALLPSLKWQKELFGVSDDMFHILTDHFNISDRMLKDSVQIVQTWYSKQSHFPNVRLDDRTVARMLAVNKFSIEKLKQKLENFFTSRNVMPEFFAHRDPWSPDISKALDSMDWIFIPKLTKEHYRLQIVRINPEDIDLYDPTAAFAAGFMVADVRARLDIAMADIILWDLSNLKFNHVAKINPVVIKKLMFTIEQCYGARIRQFHLLNTPPFAEFLITILKASMRKKVANRVFMHKSTEDLFKEIPKEFIPKDMGGNFPRTTREIADDLRMVIKTPEWREWYVDSVNYKTDESKRGCSSETHVDDLLGLRGTFRRLDID